MDRRNKTIIGACVAVVVLLAVGIALWLIFSPPGANEPTGGLVDEGTYVQPVAVERTTAATTALEDITVERTTTEQEGYVEQFLAEANTYSITVEATTLVPGAKPYFHVVTDGTVTDSNSLEGLTGIARDIGDIVLKAGFRYDSEQGIFYSESESWQRNFGYSYIYDVGAAVTGMYYDTMRLNFTYGDYDWRFQIWKGRYGITTGGEMGLYYKEKGTDSSFFKCVPDSDTITMSYALYEGDELYMTRGPERHWWLTGFRLFDMINPDDLTMHATYFMDNAEMADALEQAIVDLGFVKDVNYQRLGLTMTIIWN